MDTIRLQGLDPSAHAVTLRVGLSEPQKRSSRLRQSRGAAANIAASSTDSGDNFLFGARPGLESSEGFSHKAGCGNAGNLQIRLCSAPGWPSSQLSHKECLQGTRLESY